MIPTLQLYDTAHNKLCGLTNYSDLYVEQATGTSTTPIVLDQLHFKYALEDSRRSQIDYECYVVTEDAEYIVKEINLQTVEGGTSGATWVEYVCDLNVEPLKGTLLDNFAPGSALAEDAANLALAGTGWTVGYSDITKRRTAAGTNCTVFEALEDIAKAYSCDVIFDTVRKQVIFHQQQGADRGAYFAEQLNLKSLQVQGNSRSYCTRLYPRGKDGLTIASVNGGVPYVSNYQYSTKVVRAYWTDNRYTSAADMMADAQDRLAYLSKPTRAYSANIVDLARVSDQWSLLDFQIGDTITLLSYSAGIREQQRIVKIDRYLDETEKSTCEISNKIASLDDIVLRVSDAAETVDAATDSTGTIMGSSVQVTNPDGTYTTLTSAVATIGTLIATKATITDLQAATARITTLEATSVTAAYLTANYITADSIRANYATIGDLNVQTARIDNLVSSQITTDYLTAHYAAIDLSNIGTGIIQTAMIATGAVQTAQIADGSITDAKIVGLTANKITAGTIDASKITVTNLNCANLTVGTINGQQIASGAIDTSKLTSSLNSTISTAASNASSALTAASTAQTTANGKNTAYYQSSVPSGGTYKANDVWYDTDDGYKMYYYSGSAWTAAALGNDAIATLDAGKITTGYLAAARIAASTITGTMIAGATVTAANIAANTITATQIATGTITATQIASRTITADRIVAGAITANEIAAHTITATQIAANTITAGQIAAGTITSTQINVSDLISALNVSTQTLYAQRITTSGSTVYGTIGSWTGKVYESDTTNRTCTGFIVRDSTNTDLYHMVTGYYGDDSSPITLIRSNGPMYMRAVRVGTDTIMSKIYMNSDVVIAAYGDGTTPGTAVQIDYTGLAFLAGSTGSAVFKSDTFGNVQLNSITSISNPSTMKIATDGLYWSFNNGTGWFKACGQTYSETNFPIASNNINWISKTDTYLAVNGSSFAVGVSFFNSDRRLKTNIMPATLDALGAIRRFSPVQFDWISNGKHQDIGYVAQDMQTAYPAAVFSVSEDAYLQLNPTILLPLTMRAVQQVDDNVIALAQRVDSLTARDDYQDNDIAALKAQIISLQAQIDALKTAA